jgi:hypothetical protein
LRLGDKAVAEGAITAFEAVAEAPLPKLRGQLRRREVGLRLEANSNVWMGRR